MNFTLGVGGLIIALCFIILTIVLVCHKFPNPYLTNLSIGHTYISAALGVILSITSINVIKSEFAHGEHI